MATPLSAGVGWRRVEPPAKFSKRSGLDRTSTFTGRLLGKRVVTFSLGGGGGGVEIFFSVITKNLNWEILSKNLVTFKR